MSIKIIEVFFSSLSNTYGIYLNVLFTHSLQYNVKYSIF